MKTEKLRMALERYESLLFDVLPSSEAREGLNLAKRAQQELSELTELVDVVKGFIEYNKVDSLNNQATVRESLEFIRDICDIAGYKD